jgi:hypothetical protein
VIVGWDGGEQGADDPKDVRRDNDGVWYFKLGAKVPSDVVDMKADRSREYENSDAVVMTATAGRFACR